MRSRSLKSLNRNSCTSSVTSGPPKFKRTMPVLGFFELSFDADATPLASLMHAAKFGRVGKTFVIWSRRPAKQSARWNKRSTSWKFSPKAYQILRPVLGSLCCSDSMSDREKFLVLYGHFVENQQLQSCTKL